MKYIRKFATRRELADWERMLDRYNWYTLEELGSTAPPDFSSVISGDNKNTYDSLSEITDDVLATTSVIIFKAENKYYKRIPRHMLWRVINYKKDDGTTVSRGNDAWGEEKGVVGYFIPMGVDTESDPGDFLLEDFNNDFLVPTLLAEFHWTEITQSAIPQGYTFTEGQDICSSIDEVKPAVQDDYMFIKVGSKYYRRDLGPEV